MDLKEYADLVKRMRRKQNLYFRTRSQSVLAECRSLEDHVDRETDALLNPPTPTLFNPRDKPEESHP